MKAITNFLKTLNEKDKNNIVIKLYRNERTGLDIYIFDFYENKIFSL